MLGVGMQYGGQHLSEAPMPRFSANLSTMFTELPVLERFALAADCGFTAVEMQFPYDMPATGLHAALASAGQQMVLINAPRGDSARGERGLGCLPERRAAFRESVLRALDVADTLGCRMVHVMAGIAPPDAPDDVLTGTFAVNLAWASEQAAGGGILLNLEPINRHDVPGYFLRTMAQGEALVRAIGAENIGLQFDLYHCQMTEGNLSSRLARHMPVIHHIQLADVPGRHEPGTGEIGWAHLLRTIDALGYTGWVGCEYTPTAGTAEGLGWREAYA
jgi:2-dehydrotetronate isomerase